MDGDDRLGRLQHLDELLRAVHGVDDQRFVDPLEITTGDGVDQRLVHVVARRGSARVTWSRASRMGGHLGRTL
jgi:hypothetical protein